MSKLAWKDKWGLLQTLQTSIHLNFNDFIWVLKSFSFFSCLQSINRCCSTLTLPITQSTVRSISLFTHQICFWVLLCLMNFQLFLECRLSSKCYSSGTQFFSSAESDSIKPSIGMKKNLCWLFTSRIWWRLKNAIYWYESHLRRNWKLADDVWGWGSHAMRYILNLLIFDEQYREFQSEGRL